MRPTSGVVVTSAPRRLKPPAMAPWQFSSRWKRIVRGIGLPGLQEFLQAGRPCLGLQFLDESLPLFDGSVDLLAIFVVVGEGCMNVRQGDGRVMRHDFVGAHAHPLVPDGHVLDGDAVPVDAWLASARAGCADDSYPVE